MTISTNETLSHGFSRNARTCTIVGALQIMAGAVALVVPGWGWMAINGIITVALGVLIFTHFPLSGAWAIGILFGVKLLSSGMATIAIGSALRHGARTI